MTHEQMFIDLVFKALWTFATIVVAIVFVAHMVESIRDTMKIEKLQKQNLRLAQELEAAKRLVVRLADTSHDHEIGVYADDRLVGGIKVRKGQVYFYDISYKEGHKLAKVQDLSTSGQTHQLSRQSRLNSQCF
jgi:hypothetical protein